MKCEGELATVYGYGGTIREPTSYVANKGPSWLIVPSRITLTGVHF